MSKLYSDAEGVAAEAQRLIPLYHPELATARMRFIYVDKASQKNGRPIYGKVKRVSGNMEFLLELDFLIEVGLDAYNELTAEQRTAAIDHLLEQCTGEEDEKTGEMKWSMREPDVREFTTIFRRNGAWQDHYAEFIAVAKLIDVDSIVAEVTSDVAETVLADV